MEMKKSEFRKLIREEVRKVLNEAGGKAYALAINDDGAFIKADLTQYSSDKSLFKGVKLAATKAHDYVTDTEATTDIAAIQKYQKAITTLQNNYDFYDVTGDTGEALIVAAVPMGSKLSSYLAGSDKKDIKLSNGLRLVNDKQYGEHLAYKGYMLFFDTIHYYLSTKKGMESSIEKLVKTSEPLQQFILKLIKLGEKPNISDMSPAERKAYNKYMGDMVKSSDPKLASQLKALTNFF